MPSADRDSRGQSRAPWLVEGVPSVVDRELALADLVAAQRGVVSRAQMSRLGFGPDVIDRRLRQRRLHRIHRGVYAIGHVHLAPLADLEAALLACGPTALLSHRTAAWLWGFMARSGVIDVTVVGARLTQRPGIRAHETRVLPAADRSRRQGLPVTAPQRTLLDLAEVAGPDELAEALGQARVARWVTPASLLDYARAATGRHGALALKAVVTQAHAEGFTRSKAERKLLELVRAAHLPPPETNVVLFGRERDAVWRRQRVVVEVDSWEFHSGRPAFEADKLREAELAAHGWRTVPITWRQLTQDTLGTVARLAAALAAPMGDTRQQWPTGNTPPP